MKKICFIVIACFVLCTTLLAQNNKKWDFPIKPGTAEWSKLKTYEQRLDAYNIPDEILLKMHTAELAKTCLNYPELRLIMTRNSLQQGYDYLKTIFNGFVELEKRKDAGAELIKIYKSTDPNKISSFSKDIDRGAFVFSFTYVELLLSQEPILSNIKNKKELLALTISNYEAKEKRKIDYATFGLRTTALIMGRVLRNENYNTGNQQELFKNEVTTFIDKTNGGNPDVLKSIYIITKNYLEHYENN